MKPPDRTGQTWTIGSLGTYLIVGPARFEAGPHPLNRSWYHPAILLDGWTPSQVDLGEWDMGASWEFEPHTRTRVA